MPIKSPANKQLYYNAHFKTTSGLYIVLSLRQRTFQSIRLGIDNMISVFLIPGQPLTDICRFEIFRA